MNSPSQLGGSVALGLLFMFSLPPSTHAEPPEYPQARRSDHTDMLHGESVADPYRWMEEIDAPETRRWIEAQSALTRRTLDALLER
ncbi:MAG: hypothetical protein KDK99_21040, partial [Verrucomicrobiales bacterium]|nr:hypothetical protein [Verrucomicrobiales bacterium]